MRLSRMFAYDFGPEELAGADDVLRRFARMLDPDQGG
jgi:hypothetical protein